MFDQARLGFFFFFLSFVFVSCECGIFLKMRKCCLRAGILGSLCSEIRVGVFDRWICLCECVGLWIEWLMEMRKCCLRPEDFGCVFL